MFYYTNYLYPSLRNENQSRYVGLFWPFVGGLLLGGLVGNNIGDNKGFISPNQPYYPKGAGYTQAGPYPYNDYGPIYYPTSSNLPNPSYYINPYQPTNIYVDSETSINETPMYSYPPYNYL